MKPSIAARVVATAAREIGVSERPPGSNTGPRVRGYQAATTLGGTGWPWCAAFVQWVWVHAGVDAAEIRRVCSPSTQVFADAARRLGWVGPARPGAAVVWPGRHTEILVAPAGDVGVWHTIGGNVADGVRRKTRSLAGAVVVAPPSLGGDHVPPARLYFLEDLSARPRLAGPWRFKGDRERVIARLPPGQQARARRIRIPRGYAFLLGPRRVYGPWLTSAARDEARAVLERRLGHRVRPYSRPAPATHSTGAAEGLGKTT